MATYYWVGSSGNWSDAANHWSNSSGGSPSASYLPTATDDVVFDANSNTGTGAFTVTVDGTSVSPSLCQNFSTGGAGGALDGAMTLAFGTTTNFLDVYGNFTLPATNFSTSGGTSTSDGQIRFSGNGTNTITTNGVSLTPPISIGSGGSSTGTWTLGSALTTTNFIFVVSGTFSTSASNYSLSSSSLNSSFSNTRTINLNASTVTVSGTSSINFLTSTNLTFTAGTSTITCSNTSPSFNGGGVTFYNVTFSSTGTGTTTITGANTFNNLTQTSRSATGNRFITLSANQTVSGTLTIGAANTAIRRIRVGSDVNGTQRTITLNGTLAALADVDFRDINAAGSVATPWTGTRLGDCLGNANITFTAAKTVYWNLAGTQNWSATGWATTNNGTPNANNFPLPQDTATFTEAGSAGTVTIDQGWQIGTIQMADGVSNRTTAFTFATGTQTPSLYGNVTLFSNLTLTGTGTLNFLKQGATAVITSAGISWTQPITVNAPSGTFQLADNLTNTGTTFTLTSGTLDLSSGNRTLTCVTFSSTNSNTRTIAFGTGNITVTGNNATVWSCANLINFSYTGTPTVNLNYSGSTGTRTIQNGSSGGTETNAVSMNVTAGSDTITLSTNGVVKNLSFAGFTGSANLPGFVYGNLTLGSGSTQTASTAALTFAATSGTQTITSNGVTIDRPVTINAPGAIVQCQDALTLGSTRTLTMTNGTLQLKAGVTSTVGGFATSGTNQKYLQSTLAGTQATLSDASGTVSVSYLTIQDINATGGATWNAFYQQGNIDAGDNTGWYFGETPIIGAEVTMRLRSFTEPRRF